MNYNKALHNPIFKIISKAAQELGISERTLYRKIKSVANLSPNELIIVTRLKKAAELLVQSDYKIQR